MNPILLTDLNIEAVVSSFREALSKYAQEIDSDISIAPKGRIEIINKITIVRNSGDSYGGNVFQEFEYTPLIRRHSSKTQLEDARQFGLLK